MKSLIFLMCFGFLLIVWVWWDSLWYKICFLSFCGIIVVGLVVYFWDIFFLVVMIGLNWCCLFQGIRFLGIKVCCFVAFLDVVEKIQNEKQLKFKSDNCCNCDYLIDGFKLFEGLERVELVVVVWYFCYINIVYGLEDDIGVNYCILKVDFVQGFIYELAKYFGKLVVYVGKGVEKGCYIYNDVEVCYNEISIVQLYVNG